MTVAVNVAVLPGGMFAGPLIVSAVGATHATTVTGTATLSTAAAPQPLETRTQYVELPFAVTLTESLVAPLSGLAVLPLAPTYH